MDEAKAWAEGFDKYVEDLKKDTDSALSAAEAAMYAAVMSSLLPSLLTENGYLSPTAKNLAKAAAIERLLYGAAKSDLKDASAAYIAAILGISEQNAKWYEAIGQPKERIEAIKAAGVLEKVFDISEGKAIPGGYVDRLARAQSAMDKIKMFVLSSIAAGQKVKDFVAGIANTIKGTKETPGAVRAVWREHAFDNLAKGREVDNLNFANELGLRYFIYTGGLIESSRDFCIKKNGKVFERSEAIKEWPKDPDLIDKAHVAAYRPLIDRGRYNCRHFIMWISDEMAQELLKK